MAVTGTNVLANGSGTDATSYVTASLSVTSGRLYLLTVRSAKSTAGTDNTPTVTGAGQTWAQVATRLDASDSTRRLTVFRCIAGSTTSGALTIDFAGQTQTLAGWTVDEFTGHTPGSNGASAIIQSTGGDSNGSSVTSFSLTLSAFGYSGNATWGVIQVTPFSLTVTQGSGFSELVEDGASGQGKSQTEFKATPDTGVDWTLTSGIVAGAIALEIQVEPVVAAAVAATGTGQANDAKIAITTTGIAATGTGQANDATVYYTAPPRSFSINGVDYVGDTLYADFVLTECANRGEVGTGGIDLLDGISSMSIPALKAVEFDDPAAGSSNKRVYTGFTHDRSSGALPGSEARVFDVEMTDLNILASDFVLTDAEGADRPAETDYVRMAWLMTTALNSVGGVGIGVMPNANTVTLEATDYRGKKPADVAAECSEAAQKLWFIYDYGSGRKIYYDLATGTSLSSTAKISDLDADTDGSTVWAPQPSVKVKRSPDRIYSGGTVIYTGGMVHVGPDSAVVAQYRPREFSVLNAAITDSTVATVFANALLDGAATEITEIEGLTIIVPAANVNDIRAGQRVEIKLTRHDIDAYAWYRVVARSVAPLNNKTHYEVSLRLADNVLASAVGARGGDVIWPNKSNANDDGATVITDRGGLSVIDGAITVVNSGATVIIDGESNMFKIATSGTQAVTETAAGETETDISLGGLGTVTEPRAFLSYIGRSSTSAPAAAASSTHRALDRVGLLERYFASDTSGGVANDPVVSHWTAGWMTSYISSSTLLLQAHTINNGGVTEYFYFKYYVLQESAL